MPRAQWTLQHGRPCVQVDLIVADTGQRFPRMLLADTGAGARNAPYQLVLDESDCLLCGGRPVKPTSLGGAYSGWFMIYHLAVRLPALGFDRQRFAVGVETPPPGFDGIAGFGFLNRFTYGNFGDPALFGLET